MSLECKIVVYDFVLCSESRKTACGRIPFRVFFALLALDVGIVDVVQFVFWGRWELHFRFRHLDGIKILNIQTARQHKRRNVDRSKMNHRMWRFIIFLLIFVSRTHVSIVPARCRVDPVRVP